MTDTTIAYITKFALETGQVVEAAVTRKNDHYCIHRHHGQETQFRWGVDVFADRDDAVAAAQSQIERKIGEHQRQIDRLRAYSL